MYIGADNCCNYVCYRYEQTLLLHWTKNTFKTTCKSFSQLLLTKLKLSLFNLYLVPPNILKKGHWFPILHLLYMETQFSPLGPLGP